VDLGPASQRAIESPNRDLLNHKLVFSYAYFQFPRFFIKFYLIKNISAVLCFHG
jgi:hypothetical protein